MTAADRTGCSRAAKAAERCALEAVRRNIGSGAGALFTATTLATFAARVAPAGERADMALGELASDGRHLDRLTLSTLHSAKGREFGVVFMFDMDVGRLPRNGAGRQQLAEARRLFYIGLTRAKAEVHLVPSTRRASPFVDEIEHHLAEEP